MAKKDEIEMESLNLLTAAFIDTVEDRARRHLIMKNGRLEKALGTLSGFSRARHVGCLKWQER